VALYDTEIDALSGEPMDLRSFQDKAVLVVNVASLCGLTPQYSGLERLQERYGDRGFSVLGVPCNQFGQEEPGTAEEIEQFCSLNYGVTFPMTSKVDVNGPERHPLYGRLTEVPDTEGAAGDVQWNFEKFLVAPGAASIRRFRPQTDPEAPEVISAIEAVLPGTPA
jgi:glutathione peroxidase